MKLNDKTTKGCAINGAAVLATCTKLGLDPVDVLENTIDHPKARKANNQLEYLAGWFRGVADTAGVNVKALWKEIEPSAQAWIDREERLMAKDRARGRAA